MTTNQGLPRTFCLCYYPCRLDKRTDKAVILRACDFFDPFVFSTYPTSCISSFQPPDKAVILRACDFFDPFVFSTIQPVVFQLQTPTKPHPEILTFDLFVFSSYPTSLFKPPTKPSS